MIKNITNHKKIMASILLLNPYHTKLPFNPLSFDDFLKMKSNARKLNFEEESKNKMIKIEDKTTTKTNLPPEPDFIVTHAGCNDGIASAWLVLQFCQVKKPKIIPRSNPIGNEFKLSNGIYWFVDICPVGQFSDEEKQNMYVIDHHVSNEQVLKTFDNSHYSPEMATCKYLSQLLPLDLTLAQHFIINMIAERDVGNFYKDDKIKRDQQDQICGAVYNLLSKSRDKMTEFDKIMNTSVIDLCNKGKEILLKTQVEIEKTLESAVKADFVSKTGTKTPVILFKTRVNRTDVFKQARDKFDEQLFVFYDQNRDNDQEFFISLRARDDFDALALTKGFCNSGGHQQACGFTIYSQESFDQVFLKNKN